MDGSEVNIQYFALIFFAIEYQCEIILSLLFEEYRNLSQMEITHIIQQFQTISKHY